MTALQARDEYLEEVDKERVQISRVYKCRSCVYCHTHDLCGYACSKYHRAIGEFDKGGPKEGITDSRNCIDYEKASFVHRIFNW